MDKHIMYPIDTTRIRYVALVGLPVLLQLHAVIVGVVMAKDYPFYYSNCFIVDNSY